MFWLWQLPNTHSYVSMRIFSLFQGGITDNVSKWVFRQNLAPERLKEILQKREDKEAGDKLEQKAGEEGNEKEKSQEDTDRTAGQDLERLLTYIHISIPLNEKVFPNF